MLFNDPQQPLITDASEEPSRPSTRSCKGTQQEQHAAHLSMPKQTVEQHVGGATEQTETTLEGAISQYLHEHEISHSSNKTLEWHQTALGLMRTYLEQERGLTLVSEVEAPQMRSWLTHLRKTAGGRGKGRSERTIQTYARSAHAFFGWLVHQTILQTNPFDRVVLPKIGEPVLEIITDEEFERLLLACASPHEDGCIAERAAVRNRAILWVFYDTGIRVSELTSLRVGDVDGNSGVITINGKGAKERRIALGQNCLRHLRSYLELLHSRGEAPLECSTPRADHLFLGETGQPLTNNAITLLFARLKKRAGITDKPISPRIFQHTFAIRYLELSHDPVSLQKLLGYEDITMIKYHIQRSKATIREQKSTHSLDDHLPSILPEPKGTRRRGFRGKEP